MKNVIAYKTVKTESAVASQIETVAKHAATLKASAQQAAISVIQHAERTGDVRIGNKLIGALGEAGRGKAMVQFLVTYGHFSVGKDEETGKQCFTGFANGMSHKDAQAAIRATFSEAKATWWTSTIKEDAFRGYNANQALADLMKKHAKMLEKLPDLTDEQKGKVNMIVSADLMQQALRLFNIDFEQVKDSSEEAPEAGTKAA